MIEIIILVMISFLFGTFTCSIAAKRGANKGFWFIMGFMAWFFALPFVFFAKGKQTKIGHEQNERKEKAIFPSLIFQILL